MLHIEHMQIESLCFVCDSTVELSSLLQTLDFWKMLFIRWFSWVSLHITQGAT